MFGIPVEEGEEGEREIIGTDWGRIIAIDVRRLERESRSSMVLDWLGLRRGS